MSGVTLTQIGDMVVMYAYPVAFLGAVFLTTTEFFSIEVSSIFQDTLAKWLYVFVGLSGIVSLFTWFNTPTPFLAGNFYNTGKVKQNVLQP